MDDVPSVAEGRSGTICTVDPDASPWAHAVGVSWRMGKGRGHLVGRALGLSAALAFVTPACDSEDPPQESATTGMTSESGTTEATTDAATAGSTGGCAELNCGLIHAYKFAVADALSDEVGAADATLVKVSASAEPGQADGAWRFDAAEEDHVDLVPGMLHGLPALTLCVWFRVESLGMGTLFSWRSSLDGGVLQQSFGEINWRVISSVENGPIGANTWHLVCGETDLAVNDGLRLYIDGELRGDDLPRALANDGDDPLVVIGANADLFDSSLTAHWSGLIDEVYLWNRSLSAAEHAELAGLGGAAFW